MNPIRWYRNLRYNDAEAFVEIIFAIAASISILAAVCGLVGSCETDKKCSPQNFPGKTIQLHLEPLPPR